MIIVVWQCWQTNRLSCIRKDLLQLGEGELSSCLIWHLFNITSKAASRHVNQNRVACSLVKVKEIAASISAGGNDPNKLHIRPENLAEVKNNFVLNSNRKFSNCFFLPLWKSRLKFNNVCFQNTQRNSDYCSICNKCFATAYSNLYPVPVANNFNNPKKNIEGSVLKELQTKLQLLSKLIRKWHMHTYGWGVYLSLLPEYL